MQREEGMRLSHDDIKEMFPEYLRGILPKDLCDDMESHLKDCEECRNELFFVAKLVKVNVPDPGEFFWKTLPQKVIGAVNKEKAERFSIISFLFRPLPVAVTIAALFLLVFTYFGKKERMDLDPFFKDPFTAAVLDYSNITERDIPIITEQPITYESYSENFMEHSYHREFVSLSSKEMESLYEALGKEQKRGG